MKRSVSTILASLLVSWSPFASAQIGSWFGPTNSLNTQSIVSHDMMRKMLAKSGVGVTRNGYASANASTMSYTVSEAASRQAETTYLARLRNNDPAAAAQLAEAMHRHDFGKIYQGIVAPFGLRRGDAADAMTAYTMLGWLIATGSGDPTRAQVQALRATVAPTLAADPRFADPTTRAIVGEEVVITFVTLHAGWQSARREGKLREYSDGVAAMFEKQTGNDLRQLVLTDRGLERRG